MSRFTAAPLLLALITVLGGCVTRHAYPASSPSPKGHPMYERAEQAYLRGNLEESLKLFQGYREGFAPEGATSYALLWEGIIELERGRIEPARERFQEAAQLANHPNVQANAYTGLGDCAFAQDRLEEATAHYQRALDLRVPEARNDYTLYRLGVTRQRRGDWGGGHSYFQLVLRDHKTSPMIPKIKARMAFPARRFYLDAGTFQTEDAARQLERVVLSRGGDAQVVSATPEGPYRVLLGGFTRYETAKLAMSEYGKIIGQKSLRIVP